MVWTTDRSAPALLKRLDAALVDIGYSKCIDRSEWPDSVPKFPAVDCLSTVCLLTDPVYHICIAIEGAKRSTGAVQLALASEWIDRVERSDEPGVFDLFLKKGLWFWNDQAYVDVFSPPRKITYFANFFTIAASGITDEGVVFEGGLDCPQSSSFALERMVNNKLHTRMLISKAGVSVPATLGFTYKPELSYDLSSDLLRVVDVPNRDDVKPFLREHIKAFLTSTKSAKIVVKPSGPLWMESKLVSFHERHKLDEIVEQTNTVLQQLNEGDSVLLEVFIVTAPSHIVLSAREHKLQAALTASVSTATNDSALVQAEMQELEEAEEEELAVVGDARQSDLSFRLRVVVQLNALGVATVSKMVCGVGLSSGPVNGDNSLPLSLDGLLDQWGMGEKKFKHTLMDTVKSEACRSMEAIQEWEQTLTPQQRGNTRARTECIGLDFVLTVVDKVIIPSVIEINDHDCTFQAQLLEFMIPGTVGECVRPWVGNMIMRSQEYICSKKTLLLVGGGGFSKRFVYDVLREMNITTVLVDEDAGHYAKDLVEVFMPIEGLAEHKNDHAIADQIIANLEKSGRRLDGCMTFWEDCGPLAALLAEKLNLVGNGFDAQMRAKDKNQTQATLWEASEEMAHRPKPSMFAVQQIPVNTTEDLEKALTEIQLPAVLKLAYGSSACGVVLTTTKKECRREWKKLKDMFVKEADHGGIGLGFGTTILLCEFIDGSEHDVDIVMFDGACLAAFVSDNGPTRLPLFNESSAAMPSLLHADKQASLIAAAQQCVKQLGLHSGVFNVELKYTARGPKLIEVNARMGGFYIRDWVRRVWGCDLAKTAIIIALGISPMLPTEPQPRGTICGLMMYASKHGDVMREAGFLERMKRLHKQGVIVYNQFEQHIPEVEQYEEPFASMAVLGETPEIAKAKLEMIWQGFGFEENDLPASWYLQNFCDKS